jgi:hypothetical protein
MKDLLSSKEVRCFPTHVWVWRDTTVFKAFDTERLLTDDEKTEGGY